MAINNHFKKSFSELDLLLKKQATSVAAISPLSAYDYARSISEIENVIAVVSDMVKGTSRIFCGAFASKLGIDEYNEEGSIWEKRILSMMSETEQEAKIIAELRFYHYIRHLGKNKRNYYLMSKLRLVSKDETVYNVLHKMYYIFDESSETILYAICLYGPLTFDFKGKSVIVNSITGHKEELDNDSGIQILSKRERQVLSLIDSGLKSEEIAAQLNISRYTVNRHRQEILAKLQVKNSIEACRIARSLELLS